MGSSFEIRFEYAAIVLALVAILGFALKAYFHKFFEAMGGAHGSTFAAWISGWRKSSNRADVKDPIWGIQNLPSPRFEISREAVATEPIDEAVFAASESCVLIYGAPGTGKSVLLRQWINKHRDSFDLIIVVAVDTSIALEPSRLCFTLLDAVSSQYSKKFTPFDVRSLSDLLAEFVALLSDRKTLVALDNLQRLEEDVVEQILLALRGIPHLHVIGCGTSKILTISHWKMIRVCPLSPVEYQKIVGNYLQEIDPRNEREFSLLLETIPENYRTHPGLLSVWLTVMAELPSDWISSGKKFVDLFSSDEVPDQSWLDRLISTADFSILKFLIISEGTQYNNAQQILQLSHGTDEISRIRNLLKSCVVENDEGGIKVASHLTLQIVNRIRRGGGDFGHEVGAMGNSLDAILNQWNEDTQPEELDDILRMVFRLFDSMAFGEILTLLNEERTEKLAHIGAWNCYWDLCGIGHKAAAATGETRAIWDFGLRLSRRAAQRGEISLGMSVLDALQSTNLAVQDVGHEIDIWTHRSTLLYAAGDLSDAENAVEQAESLLERSQQLTLHEGVILLLRCSLAQTKNDIDQIEDFARRTLSLYSGTHQSVRVALEARLYLSSVLTRRNETSEAELLVNEVLDLATTHQHFSIIPKACLQLAQIQRQTDQLNDLLDTADRGIRLSHTTDPRIIVSLERLREETVSAPLAKEDLALAHEIATTLYIELQPTGAFADQEKIIAKRYSLSLAERYQREPSFRFEVWRAIAEMVPM